MKEKKLELKKIEMVKQDTFERVNRKKNKTGSPDFKPRKRNERRIKTKDDSERFGKRRKNHIINDKPCKFCNAPNWNPTHKGLALDKHCNNCGKKDTLPEYVDKTKTSNAKYVMYPEATAMGGESGESESSIYKFEKNRITDSNTNTCEHSKSERQ